MNMIQTLFIVAAIFLLIAFVDGIHRGASNYNQLSFMGKLSVILFSICLGMIVLAHFTALF